MSMRRARPATGAQAPVSVDALKIIVTAARAALLLLLLQQRYQTAEYGRPWRPLVNFTTSRRRAVMIGDQRRVFAYFLSESSAFIYKRARFIEFRGLHARRTITGD